ncbi:hypothetical protein F511_28913 [Dorcoceras hygrometricum]|uniref:Retrovirus-related Pol polyprotein from transposon TNT 1-94-like beta-barrel domain-containing protein n=1 Tax=Dorcoceras hygrometricum TaxID=472368 RepID=A0A2Z7AE72_9LAMI|nr:hypothetical protein F511_28913 [Dorcoceras hygrometricum]
MHDGIERILREVRYVPELKRNLISLGALDQAGYCFKAEHGRLAISKGALVVMKGIRTRGLYVLLGDTVVGTSALLEEQRMKQLGGIIGWGISVREGYWNSINRDC